MFMFLYCTKYSAHLTKKYLQIAQKSILIIVGSVNKNKIQRILTHKT